MCKKDTKFTYLEGGTIYDKGQAYVYLGHRRIFDYVEDICRTFANIVYNFKSGEVYNVGGKEEWKHDIKYEDG